MAAPVATIDNRTLRINEWGQLKTWLTYLDADNNPAVRYQFFDSTGANSGYFWTPDNAHHPNGTYIDVEAADLASVYVYGGAAVGSDLMWVRAFDGTDWSNWDTFVLNTIANAAPVATINDHSLQRNEWAQVSAWISYSDADGNSATKYQFWDSGTAATSGYFWTPGNEHHTANTVVEVAATNLADVWVRGGAVGGAETMWVRAFDGAAWGAWDALTLTTIPNSLPVATINDHSLQRNEWAQISTWLSYSDGNGEAATKYQFWDSGTAATSGYFWTPGNEHHTANSVIEMAATDLADLWVRGGTAGTAETMWVRKS